MSTINKRLKAGVFTMILNGLKKIEDHANRWIYMSRYYIFLSKFKQREDDIYIFSYMSSGTNWLQMIMYQLKSDGKMDFYHISEVVPYLNQMLDRAEELNTWPSPRVFHSHAEYDELPKEVTGRIIYISRHGMDVAVSYYHHIKSYQDPELEFDQFFERYYTQNEDWFRHVRGWRDNNRDLNILYITYEDLKSDFEQTIRKIADFCGIDLNEEKLQRVKERSTFQFMKENAQKFGIQLPKGIKLNNHMRKGQTKEGQKYLNEKHKEIYRDRYAKYLDKYDLNYN